MLLATRWSLRTGKRHSRLGGLGHTEGEVGGLIPHPQQLTLT